MKTNAYNYHIFEKFIHVVLLKISCLFAEMQKGGSSSSLF